MSPGLLPMMLASTLRRPRWAMPSTASSTPASAARSMMSSSSGMSARRPRARSASCRRTWCGRSCSKSSALARSLEDRELRVAIDVRLVEARLDALPEPGAALTLGDVHRLDADRATEGGAEPAQDLAQRGLLEATQATRGDDATQIRAGEAVVRGIELAVRIAHQLAERIDLRLEMAGLPVGVDERVDARVARLVVLEAALAVAVAEAIHGPATDRGAVAGVGAVRVSVAARRRRRRVHRQIRAAGLEESAPARIDRGGVTQKLLIELIEERSVLRELEYVVGHRRWNHT